MMHSRTSATFVAVAFALSLGGCAAKSSIVPAGTAQADEFLFQRGEAELKERHWAAPRDTYLQLVDNLPQSQHRSHAKLAVRDIYIGEDTAESLVPAVIEFREFNTYYPTNESAYYAQYRLAYAYSQQKLAS